MTPNKEHPMLPNLDPGSSVRLRPPRSLSLAALEAALAIREHARVENAEADRGRGRSFAASMHQRQAFSTWSNAAGLAAHSFAWLLADMLGTGPWNVVERWPKGVSKLLDEVDPPHQAMQSRLVDHVTAYRHHGSSGSPGWHDTAFVLQPYVPAAQLAADLAALNAMQDRFYIEAIPRLWGWYAPDNPTTKAILVFGRVHAAPPR